MSEIVISVTQRDIDNGMRFSASGCAIACAFKRQTRRVVRVLLGEHRITGRRVEWSLDTDAQKWAHDFDNGKRVEPREFTFRTHDPLTGEGWVL